MCPAGTYWNAPTNCRRPQGRGRYKKEEVLCALRAHIGMHRRTAADHKGGGDTRKENCLCQRRNWESG